MAKYECGDRSFIFAIGAPGAGKGTLSKQLAMDNDFTHISIGGLLRATTGRDGDIMQMLVTGFVKNNELLPSPWLFPIIWDAISATPDGRTIILDGFPRCFEQAIDFERSFAAPVLVLFFNCAEDVAKERVVNRNDGREGDNSEVFDKRYFEHVYLNQKVLIEYGGIDTMGQDKLVEVDTNGDTEASYKKLKEALRTRPEWSVLRGSPASPSPSPSP